MILMLQAQYQTLRPQTTAHLAQTMTLLSLTSEELRQQIDAELASNPALELIDERRCPICHRILGIRENCPVCSRPRNDTLDEPIVFLSPHDDFVIHSDLSRDELPEDNESTQVEDLPTYVLKQVAPDLDVDERPIAAFLLTHLDEDGFLTIPLIEAARYFHVPLLRIEKIVTIIQHADPLGVGSSSPQEALIVQLEVLAETKPVPEYTKKIIIEGMDLLSHRQYNDLAKLFKITTRQVEIIARFIIENLNPYPGRSHWGDIRHTQIEKKSIYHNPDILIYHLNDDKNNPLVVEIILPLGGTLRVNPLFRKAVQEAEKEKKDMWKNDIERASLLIKCMQQRNHTMLRLMRRVVGLQKEFILNGERYLKPITRAFISEELGVHESTISRAVSSKIVQLPNKRIIPLASFFNRNLNVRTVLKDIIEKEKRPLSDTVLVELLAKQGYNVARRTVAKYRAMEGILPAHLRHPSLISV